MSDKVQTNFRLSAEARKILKELSEEFGISQSACLEIAIRYAQRGKQITDFRFRTTKKEKS